MIIVGKSIWHIFFHIRFKNVKNCVLKLNFIENNSLYLGIAYFSTLIWYFNLFQCPKMLLHVPNEKTLSFKNKHGLQPRSANFRRRKDGLAGGMFKILRNRIASFHSTAHTCSLNRCTRWGPTLHF